MRVTLRATTSLMRTILTHPALLLVAGLLAAYLAFDLLLQGRALSLMVMLTAGVVASCFTKNMAVVFLAAIGVLYAYLTLKSSLHIGQGKAKKEEEEEEEEVNELGVQLQRM